MKTRNIPFGYKRENGKIRLHSAESKTVNEIFTAYLNGQSMLQIARHLSERHVEYMPETTGWNKARLKRIIEDVRYLGNEIYPAIIEQTVFDKAQKIKATRNTQKSIDRKAGIFNLTVPICCESCGEQKERSSTTKS